MNEYTELPGLERLRDSTFSALRDGRLALLERNLELYSALAMTFRAETLDERPELSESFGARSQSWAAWPQGIALLTDLLAATREAITPAHVETTREMLGFAYSRAWDSLKEGPDDFSCALLLSLPPGAVRAACKHDAAVNLVPQVCTHLGQGTKDLLHFGTSLRTYARASERALGWPIVLGEAALSGMVDCLRVLTETARRPATPSHRAGAIAGTRTLIESIRAIDRVGEPFDAADAFPLLEWIAQEGSVGLRPALPTRDDSVRWQRLIALAGCMGTLGWHLNHGGGLDGDPLPQILQIDYDPDRITLAFLGGATHQMEKLFHWDWWRLEEAGDLAVVSGGFDSELTAGYVEMLYRSHRRRQSAMRFQDLAGADPLLRLTFGSNGSVRNAINTRASQPRSDDVSSELIATRDVLLAYCDSIEAMRAAGWEARMTKARLDATKVISFKTSILAGFDEETDYELAFRQLELPLIFGEIPASKTRFGYWHRLPKDFFLGEGNVVTDHVGRDYGRNLRRSLFSTTTKNLIESLASTQIAPSGTLAAIEAARGELLNKGSRVVVIGLGDYAILELYHELVSSVSEKERPNWAFVRAPEGERGFLVCASQGFAEWHLFAAAPLEPDEEPLGRYLTVSVSEYPEARIASELAASGVTGPALEEQERVLRRERSAQVLFSLTALLECRLLDPGLGRWIRIDSPEDRTNE